MNDFLIESNILDAFSNNEEKQKQQQHEMYFDEFVEINNNKSSLSVIGSTTECSSIGNYYCCQNDLIE